MDAMPTRTNPAPGPGYGATKDQLLKRLSRAEGQVRGISRMVEEDRYCIDVLTQIAAAQAALDKVALGLLDDHAKHCVVDAAEGERGEKADELMAAVGRLLRRG
jgi:CsoR family transcriptional regulator, copper-sensing transcriptional repressor